jgi:Flp pilus assembly protein TadB
MSAPVEGKPLEVVVAVDSVPSVSSNAKPESENVARIAKENYAMRKAGEEYFSKMLKEAGSSRLKSSQRSTSTRERRRNRDVEDPDMMAVGMVIEGSKFYILAFVFVCCRAVTLLLMKVSHSAYAYTFFASGAFERVTLKRCPSMNNHTAERRNNFTELS